MLVLSPTDLARVQQLTTDTYKYLHPVVRAYLNEQLLEAQAYWEVTDWLERLALTRDFYQGKQAHGLGGPTRISASRKRYKPDEGRAL